MAAVFFFSDIIATLVQNLVWGDAIFEKSDRYPPVAKICEHTCSGGVLLPDSDVKEPSGGRVLIAEFATLPQNLA